MSNTRYRPAKESDTRHDRKWREAITRFADGHDYSTSARPTGEVWIDGHPIAREVVSVGAMPNNTLKQVAHNIVDIDSVIKIWGIAYSSGTGFYIPLPYVDVTTGNADMIELKADTTYIDITSDSDYSGYTGYVTIEFTRS